MSDSKRLAEIERQSERLLDDMEKVAGKPEFNTLKEQFGRLMSEAMKLKGLT